MDRAVLPIPGALLNAASSEISRRDLDAAYLECEAEEAQKAREIDDYCKHHGYHWLTTYVYTFNETPPGETIEERELNAIRLFPDVVQPSGARPFEVVWDLMKSERRLITLKSRQIMQTWENGAEALHTALYGGPAVKVPLQSETQELANYLLERVAFMYELLPRWMKKIHPLQKPITTTEIRIAPAHGAIGPGALIFAIPQGGNKLRSLTCTEVKGDEGAFQPDIKDSIKGSKPTMSAGGRHHILTTPNGKEHCHDLFTDQPSTVPAKNMGRRVKSTRPAKGIEVRWNRNGWTALRLHYSMVPWRDPDTEAGKIWHDEEKGSTPISDWEQEYEICFDAYDGTPVYGLDFKPGFHSAPTLAFREHVPIIRGWDYGYRRPYALLCQEVGKKQLLCIQEIFGRDIPIQVFADVVLWVCGKNLAHGPIKAPDYVGDLKAWREQADLEARQTHNKRMRTMIEYVNGRHIENINSFDELPRFQDIAYHPFKDYDDPSGIMHGQMSEETARSVLQRRGIHPSPGEEKAKKRVDITRELFLPLHGTDQPGVIISEDGCPLLYEAVRRGYRYPKSKWGVDDKTVPLKDGLFEHAANTLEYIQTARRGLESETYGKPRFPRNSIGSMRAARRAARAGAEPMRL